VVKQKHLKKAKAQEHDFLTSLSDLDIDFGDNHNSSSSSSKYDKPEKNVTEKLNGLCFFADTTEGGHYTMALGDEAVSGNSEAHDDDSKSEVSLFTDELVVEVDSLNTMLLSQDKLLKHATRDKNDFKAKLESALRELEFARATVVVSDETKCDAYAIHMSKFSSMQTKFASLLDENNELKSRPSLLGACKSCLCLRRLA
jgi:hypothetical protein